MPQIVHNKDGAASTTSAITIVRDGAAAALNSVWQVADGAVRLVWPPPAEVPEELGVSPLYVLVCDDSGDVNAGNVWTTLAITASPTWSGPYARDTPGTSPSWGPVPCGDTLVIFDRDTLQVETTTDTNFADGVTINTLVNLSGTSATTCRYIGSVLFTANSSGDYFISLDQGQSWTTYTSPNGAGADVVDMARLSNGRWVCHTFGSPRRAFWTDEPVPSSGWSSAITISSRIEMASSGTAIVLWDSGTTYSRTTNGSTYADITSGFTANGGIITYGGGVFIGNGSAGKIARSTDNGATFSEVAVGVGTALTSAVFTTPNGDGDDGLWLITMSGSGGTGDYLCFSDDLGLTWTNVALPFDRTDTAPVNRARIGMVDLNVYGL